MPRYPEGGGGGGGITATFKWVASDTLQKAADTIRYDVSGVYTKKKEVELGEDVTSLRVKFDLNRGIDGMYYAFGRIYVNGAPVGIERQCTSASYVTYSEDIAGGYSAGDLIQLYLHYSAGGGYPDYAAYCRNFRIYAGGSFTEIDVYTLVTPLEVTDALLATVTLN